MTLSSDGVVAYIYMVTMCMYVYHYIVYVYIYIFIYIFSPEYLVMQWRNVEKIRITTVNHCILVVPHV